MIAPFRQRDSHRELESSDRACQGTPLQIGQLLPEVLRRFGISKDCELVPVVRTREAAASFPQIIVISNSSSASTATAAY